MAMASDKIGAEPSSCYNLIRPAFSLGKLSNSACGGIAVYLDFSHDETANSESDRGARCIGAFLVNGAALFGQETDKLLGKLCSWCGEAQEGVNVGGLLLGQCWCWGKADVERETKWPTNSGDAANDASTINGTAVPSVSSSVGGFHKNGIGATIIGSNGDSFIQEGMKMLNANSLVIASSSNMMIDI